MNDSVQVNQVYLIFNRPQFLVDSSDIIYTTGKTPDRESFLYQQTLYPLLDCNLVELVTGNNKIYARCLHAVCCIA